MRLLIIRHGDPIYDPDCLTDKGKREAEILSGFLKRNYPEIKAFYISPMGRAQETAEPILRAFDQKGITLPWLREFGPFPGFIKGTIPSIYGCWDYLPEDLEKEKGLLSERCMEVPSIASSDISTAYKAVCDELEVLLEQQGYKKRGTYFEAVANNHDTIAFICHFGIECVILSHLLNVSPWVLWQGTIACCSSFTYVVSEERRKGIASFRLQQFGDIAHLLEADETPSWSGRFTECFEDDDRH